MLDLNKNFVDEVYDSNGNVVDYTLKCPENFNFAYDVVDAIAAAEPDKRALLWCNPAGEERIFTYGDLKYYSDKTANMLRSKGIGKGDMVMVILKRHYQFWFTILALHKLGAVIIPATFMLQKHDIVYRANAATIKAVICTGDGEIAEHVDAALPECPSIKTRIMVNGKRDGWDDFMTDMENADSHLERVETKYYEPMIVYFSSGTTGNPKMAMHAHTYALAHLTTAKYWHDVNADSIHLTIADTGWGKAVWGKLYGEMFMESCVLSMTMTSSMPQKYSRYSKSIKSPASAARPQCSDLCSRRMCPPMIERAQILHYRGRGAQPRCFQQVVRGDGDKAHGGLRSDGDHLAYCKPRRHGAEARLYG